MPSFYRTIFIAILLTSCGSLSTKPDSDGNSEANSDEQSDALVIIEGTLKLDDIGGSTASALNLNEGQTLSGATVFVKGFEQTSSTTDEDGAFRLEVDTATALLAESELQVLMWYTIEAEDDDTAQARFGTSEDIRVDPGRDEAYDLGEIKLTYTMGLHLSLQNESDEPLTGCSIAVEGIDDQLLMIDKDDGRYDLDYLPPDTYTLNFSCENFEKQSLSYEVKAATNLDQWQTVSTITMISN